MSVDESEPIVTSEEAVDIDEDIVPPPGSDKKFVSYIRRVNSTRRANKETIERLKKEIKALKGILMHIA